MELPSPSSPKFFVAGGTLERDVPSYVTRQADTDLLEGLQAGEFCYVLTSRQMGKSSLMVRTAERLKAEGVSVAILDLSEYGSSLSIEQWYYAMLRDLGKQLQSLSPLIEFWKQNKEIGPLHRFFQALHEIVLPALSGKLIIFVDEIDYVRSLSFSADEFFAAIRATYNSRTEDPLYHRLTFCLQGVATPADLIQNTTTTPFNIGKRIELTDFTLNEASVLQEGLSASGSQSGKVLVRVLYWTNGHPYLTQRLCQHLAALSREVSPRDVDAACKELFLSSRARERDDNLLFVREQLLKSGLDVTALLDLYARIRRKRSVIDDETNPFVGVLRLSGIVRAGKGRLVLRNRIYEQVFDLGWVASIIPDEFRRQRRAYRAGLLRAGTIGAVILVILSISGWLAIAHYLRTRTPTHNGYAPLVAASPEGKLIFTGYGYSDAILWDAQNGRKLLVLTDKYGITWHVDWAVFSPDGTRIVTDSSERAAKIWDAQTGKEILTLKKDFPISSLAFSSDGKRIVTGSEDETATIWDAQTGKELLSLKVEEKHLSTKYLVAFSSDGKRVIGYDQYTVRVFDAHTGKELLFHHNTGYSSDPVTISSDGKRILRSRWDNKAEVYDVEQDKTILTLEGHANSVNSVAFSADGSWIVTGSDDDTAKIWDAQTGKEIRTLKGHKEGVTSVAFTSDGSRIVTVSWDNTAKVWDAQSGREILTIQMPETAAPRGLGSSTNSSEE